jgi:hypothetical protein
MAGLELRRFRHDGRHDDGSHPVTVTDGDAILADNCAPWVTWPSSLPTPQIREVPGVGHIAPGVAPKALVDELVPFFTAG